MKAAAQTVASPTASGAETETAPAEGDGVREGGRGFANPRNQAAAQQAQGHHYKGR